MPPLEAARVRVDHLLRRDGLEARLCAPRGQAARLTGVLLLPDPRTPAAAVDAAAGRVAEAGHLVLAPRLPEAGDPEAVVDADEAARWLREHPRCSGRIAAVGWGSGGRLALILATSPAAPDRAVDLHGPEITRRTATVDLDHPQVAVDRVPWLRAALLAVVAEEGVDPSPADAAELGAALAARGLEHRVLLHPGPSPSADAPLDAPAGAPDLLAEVLAWLEPLR